MKPEEIKNCPHCDKETVINKHLYMTILGAIWLWITNGRISLFSWGVHERYSIGCSRQCWSDSNDYKTKKKAIDAFHKILKDKSWV